MDTNYFKDELDCNLQSILYYEVLNNINFELNSKLSTELCSELYFELHNELRFKLYSKLYGNN